MHDARSENDPAESLRERLGGLPGLAELLPALADMPPSYLVGGAVRDLLRRAEHVDLDVAVEGDAVAVARTLADRLGGSVRVHDRFGTATVSWPQRSVDLATTRRERYARPGALPEVEAADLAADLARRDFSVNAMAVDLSGAEPGRLHDPHGGRADLAAGVVRVLHDRSFIDDPTRLLRALRYEARLTGALDPHSEDLARAAIAARAPSTVSGARIRDELLELFEAPAAVRRMHELGLDRALHPALVADPELVTAAAREGGTDAALAALVARAPEALAGWVNDLHLGATRRDAVMRAARRAQALVLALRAPLQASELHALLASEPPAAVALAEALGAPREPIERYRSRLAGVRLEISGHDLVAAGVEPSPAMGRALDETLRRKLDGLVSGREEELRTALALARGGAG